MIVGQSELAVVGDEPTMTPCRSAHALVEPIV
jgi:hypothetical protein